MRFATVLLVVIVLMVTVELSETRGRGGGGRSAGSRGSRGSSRSRSRSGGSSSKPKITKNTPIKATSVRSPVIVKQTKLGSRSSTFKKVVVAYLVTRYAFSSAPVYRQGYPMYRSYVSSYASSLSQLIKPNYLFMPFPLTPVMQHRGFYRKLPSFIKIITKPLSSKS